MRKILIGVVIGISSILLILSSIYYAGLSLFSLPVLIFPQLIPSAYKAYMDTSPLPISVNILIHLIGLFITISWNIYLVSVFVGVLRRKISVLKKVKFLSLISIIYNIIHIIVMNVYQVDITLWTGDLSFAGAFFPSSVIIIISLFVLALFSSNLAVEYLGIKINQKNKGQYKQLHYNFISYLTIVSQYGQIYFPKWFWFLAPIIHFFIGSRAIIGFITEEVLILVILYFLYRWDQLKVNNSKK